MGQSTKKEESTTKQPRTVQVKLLVPYAIIAVMVVSLAAFIAGWHSHQEYETQLNAAYSRGLASKGQQ